MKTSEEKYEDKKDGDRVVDLPDFFKPAREYIFSAGQSKRIWNELYKVRGERWTLFILIYFKPLLKL